MTKKPEPTLVDRLAGPHEWGYRDPVEGGFFEDNTPFEAAQHLVMNENKIADLERSLRLRDRSLEGLRDLLDKAQQDAERWRALRQMTWDKSPLAVVVAPKGKTALLGCDCPSGDRLDQMVDEIRSKS